jgi:hypothetical protein
LTVADEGGSIRNYCICIVHNTIETISEVMLGEKVDLFVFDGGFIGEEEGWLQWDRLYFWFYAAIILLVPPLLELLLM